MISKNKVITFLIMFGLVLNINSQQFVNISDLDISLGQQTYSAPVINKSASGEDLSIAGIKFLNGVGVYSKSIIKIRIHDGHTFTAQVGVNDSKIDYTSESIKSIPLTDGKRIFYYVTETKKQFLGVEGSNGKIDAGSVVFKVIHKGKEVFNSGIMKQGDPVKEINLKLRGGN